ncbi:SGNH/GDSL hydrolase family protein [Demequina sediminicola]|uniref:SGNH/GDSL hydrolase family protein n=1 Tax=Demequina sediminicola TaxID=1095026 RepID=UPI00078026E8|nr:SGNH/GDSL hydrolase family protein [Demequina sediminicola]
MVAKARLLTIAAAVTVMLGACATPPEPPTAVFVGDSFTEGESLPAADAGARWSTTLATELGWEEINAGCAGAGYTQQGAICTTTFREQLPAYIEDSPEIIVLSGGTNDVDATGEQIAAAVRATYLSVRDTYPDATIYAVSGIASDVAPASALHRVNSAVAEAAEEIGAVYIDLEDALADRPELLTADGTQPNAEGHQVLAELTSNVIAGE